MYSLAPPLAATWRGLIEILAAQAGVVLEVLDYPAPAPLAALWDRADLGAVFMCGLPFSQAIKPLKLIAAPIPAGPLFGGLPRYWSELVVRQDSDFRCLEDTFGRRIAFTVESSQSGYGAPLKYLRNFGESAPLYREIIEPQITPLGALTAVLEGRAEVAPVDAYAFALFEVYRPELTTALRSVARTEPTPIPPLVANVEAATPLRQAFAAAHRNPVLQPHLAALGLQGFATPAPEAYRTLAADYQAARAYWRRKPLASRVHAAFV